MRIGFVTGEYPPMEGGIGAHCRILAQHLTDAGHFVSIYTDPQGQSADPRIPVMHHPGRWRYKALRGIDAWARDQKLDLVNLHYQTAAYQMSPWIHWLPNVVKSVPVVTTFHDLRFPYLFPKAGRLRDWIVMRLARASAGAIVTNHEDLQRLQYLPCAELIPIGSSVHTDLPANYDRAVWRSKAGAAWDDLLIAHFGFINHTKGIETLLASLALLVNAGKNAKLLMIGGRTGSSDPTNAAYVQQIDTLIDRLNLKTHIHWTGFVDDAAASGYFAAADVVTLPFLDGASYRRSSLMAAIAHDCAIVTTKPAVTIPTFQQQQNLMLVKPGNERALAAALMVLQRSPELREQLRQGTHQLKNEFAWDAITQANVDFFTRVLAARRLLPSR